MECERLSREAAARGAAEENRCRDGMEYAAAQIRVLNVEVMENAKLAEAERAAWECAERDAAKHQ